MTDAMTNDDYMRLDEAGLEAAVRECARITAPEISDEEFAQIKADNSPRYQNTRAEMARAITAYLSAASVKAGEVALADVAAERTRQREVEGWTPEHDDEHDRGELAQAAAAYAFHDTDAENGQPSAESLFPTTWSNSWWKPKDRRHNLVRAAALIIAEIERLDRRTLLAKFKMEGR